MRINNPDKGAFEDTVWYEIYGPTIIATNEPVNPILETRSVQIVMPESNRIFNDDVMEVDGLPYRERLLAFRARWMDQKLPDVDKPLVGRLGDILRPLRQIISIACTGETWFMNFVKNVEDSRKMDNSSTDEAMVVAAILECLDQVENGHLFHSATLSVINRGRPDNMRMTPQKLGRLSKSLGFKPYSSGDRRGIWVDNELLNRLCQRYGIKPNGDPLTI